MSTKPVYFSFDIQPLNMMCAHLSFLSSTLLLSSSNEVWGTGDDPVNLKSSLEECSFNKLTVDPSLVIQNDATADMEVAPGVIEVTIDVPLDGSSSDAIRNAVTTKVQEKLGYNLPGPYDYVLYSLEKCYGDDCGWAAYAYINSWNSVYQSGYYKQPGVLVHEVSMCIAVFFNLVVTFGDSLLTTSSVYHSLSIYFI